MADVCPLSLRIGGPESGIDKHSFVLEPTDETPSLVEIADTMSVISFPLTMEIVSKAAANLMSSICQHDGASNVGDAGISNSK